jgi:Spherulation-specific family 4
MGKSRMNGADRGARRPAGQARRLWRISLLAILVTGSLTLGGWATLAAQGSQNPPRLRLGVPAYVFPGQPPLVAVQTTSPGPGIVILNPGNGDAPFDASWQVQARRLRARGSIVLGYVHTDEATRSVADTETSIRNYLQPSAGHIAVSGIFLDEMSDSCATEPFYAQLYAYIRGLDRAAFVAANPGVPVSSCFLQSGHRVAHTFVTFEHDAAAYDSQFQGNVISQNGTYSAGQQYPAATFWHLIYGASSAQMSQIIALAADRHAGYVYATDAGLPNPWDSVASYLQAEASAAAAVTPSTHRRS